MSEEVESMSMAERMEAVNQRLFGGADSTANTPDEPVSSPAPDLAETPDPTGENTPATDPAAAPTEPVEPASTDEVEAAEGDGISLSKDEAEAMLSRMDYLESMLAEYEKSGGRPAPEPAPENAEAQAKAAEAVEARQVAEANPPAPWSPLTADVANKIGIYEDGLDIFNDYQRSFAHEIRSSAIQEFNEAIIPELKTLFVQERDNNQDMTLAHFAMRERPELAETPAQVRMQMQRARIANPGASPNVIYDAAMAQLAKDVVGKAAIQKMRGVKVADATAAKPAAVAPGTARPTAQAVKPPATMQERIQAVMERQGRKG